MAPQNTYAPSFFFAPVFKCSQFSMAIYLFISSIVQTLVFGVKSFIACISLFYNYNV